MARPLDRPAVDMRDVKDQFAACFQPPSVTDGSRLTFYFSLKSDGETFGRVRTIWLDYKGTSQDRRRYIRQFDDAFAGCLPLHLSASLARTIPGKVYFLQYDVEADGRTEVLLRPFGSDIPLGEDYRPYGR